MSEKTPELAVTKAVEVTKAIEDRTAGDALETMRAEETEVLLIVDGDRRLPQFLLSKSELERSPPGDTLKKVAKYAVPVTDSTVKATDKLDDVVRKYSGYLERWPNLPGLLVDAGGGNFKMLLRGLITQGASRVVTRGMNDGRLEGAPLDVLFYECPIDHERKLVAYYDPRNPPRCRLGHDMAPVED